MKTAISVPDQVFRDADLLAKQLKWSRSQLYSEAVRQFIQTRSTDPVTEQLNTLADQLATESTPNFGHQLIENGEWEW